MLRKLIPLTIIFSLSMTAVGKSQFLKPVHGEAHEDTLKTLLVPKVGEWPKLKTGEGDKVCQGYLRAVQKAFLGNEKVVSFENGIEAWGAEVLSLQDSPKGVKLSGEDYQSGEPPFPTGNGYRRFDVDVDGDGQVEAVIVSWRAFG